MKNGGDRNYISVGSWMLMMLITAIPIVGVIMIFVWAFVGDNESRKNYFRAILMWFVVLFSMVIFLILLGTWPVLMQKMQSLFHKA